MLSNRNAPRVQQLSGYLAPINNRHHLPTPKIRFARTGCATQQPNNAPTFEVANSDFDHSEARASSMRTILVFVDGLSQYL